MSMSLLLPRYDSPLWCDQLMPSLRSCVALLQSMGGRFSSLMPSDLSKPGSLAFESIPAKSDEYAQPSIKRELVRIFKRDGCHHCGKCSA